MLRRPPGDGRHVAQQRKYVVTLLALLAALSPLVDAQQQQRQQPSVAGVEPIESVRPVGSLNGRTVVVDGARNDGQESPLEGGDYASPNLAAATTPLTQAQQATVETPPTRRKRTASDSHDARQGKSPYINEAILIPKDASALATLAPEQSVRAPTPPEAAAAAAAAAAVRPPSNPSTHTKQIRGGSASGGGGAVSSQQSARNLEDWEVEDYVLLATVNGDLYAADRKTGTQRWHLEVTQPMVETTHFRANASMLDDDYRPEDHYLWAVEPNHDGRLYLWIPSETSAGLLDVGLTMKKLVEELSPHEDKERGIVYTGDKKTTLVSLDAEKGSVVKWFGSGASQVNEAERCLKPNALADLDEKECSNRGTITMGRTEYTVGIHRADGRPIALLKYSEWGPNTYDNDLKQQYRTSMDNRYFTSRHDGRVYGFDFTRYERAHKAAPLFTQTLASPVGRVFDVVRPWAVAEGSDPELVILPQPPPPEDDPQAVSRRSSSIYINQTEGGSWYAMSGMSYPLIVEAPRALISSQEWWDSPGNAWETLSDERMSKALIGTHFVDLPRGGYRDRLTLPGEEFGGAGGGGAHVSRDRGALDNESAGNTSVDSPEPTTVIEHAKKVPQLAANSLLDLITNPVLLAILLSALLWYQKDLRRWYNRAARKSVGSPDLKVADTMTEAPVMEVAEVPGAAEILAVNSLDDAFGADKEASLPVKSLDSGSDADKDAASGQPELGVKSLDGTLEANKEASPQSSSSSPEPSAADQGQASSTPANEEKDKKKKAHRGRRGGVKHKKGKDALQREDSTPRARTDSINDSSLNDPNLNPATLTVEDAVDQAKKLGEQPHQSRLEPDVITVTNNVEEVSGPILKMGSLEVNEDQQLGTGSNGTVVFAGKWDEREVAVKRMLIQFYDIASQETKLLRESDDHPNVIRYYAQQQRAAFLYIALELCQASLADVVERPMSHRELAQAGEKDLPNVLLQITNGLSHLHDLRIVHRDLKPQNILVKMTDSGSPRLLVSDFGLCKKLEGGQSSFGATTAHAAGTSGWRAPELLLDDDAREAGAQTMIEASTLSGSGTIGDGTNPDNLNPQGPARRATRAIDIFSLGLVYFYVLTKGSHPYGDRYMREVNIRKDNKDLSQLDVLGDYAHEARHLINHMLQFEHVRRPTTTEIMRHPFFWDAKKRLNFLCDVSDAFEKEPRDPPSPALVELEGWAGNVIPGGDFLKQLPKEFVETMAKQRKYTGGRLLDLLRALRNKRNHYEDLPDALKKAMPLYEGYLGFWTRRFPGLLLACWEVVYELQWDEGDRFREYYRAPAPQVG